MITSTTSKLNLAGVIASLDNSSFYKGGRLSALKGFDTRYVKKKAGVFMFGMLMVGIFCSPLYFLIRKKWGAFVINSILYLMGWITIWIFGLGLIFWIIGIAQAMWDLKAKETHSLMEKQAELIAEKMKEK